MIKRAIVEIDDLHLNVSYALDEMQGYMMGDSSAQFELVAHAGQDAVLRPVDGEPFNITILGGKVTIMGEGYDRPVRFLVKSKS